MRTNALLGLLLACGATAAIAVNPAPSASPCGSDICPYYASDEARRLNMAYFSGATSDAQRSKMHDIIAAHTRAGLVDWPAAAKEYFAWRATLPAATVNATLEQSLRDDYAKAVAEHSRAVAQNSKSIAEAARSASERADLERRLRHIAEGAVKARLIDPESAQFQWPYGFVYGTWKPFLGKRVEGYVTCGMINARNRLGGYTGASPFVVVLGEDGDVRLVDIGTEREFDLTTAQCEKAAKMLPRAAPTIAEDAPTIPVASVADELAKLAALRDRGVITPAEFDAQKAKLLGEQ